MDLDTFKSIASKVGLNVKYSEAQSHGGWGPLQDISRAESMAEESGEDIHWVLQTSVVVAEKDGKVYGAWSDIEWYLGTSSADVDTWYNRLMGVA